MHMQLQWTKVREKDGKDDCSKSILTELRISSQTEELWDGCANV